MLAHGIHGVVSELTRHYLVERSEPVDASPTSRSRSASRSHALTPTVASNVGDMRRSRRRSVRAWSGRCPDSAVDSDVGVRPRSTAMISSHVRARSFVGPMPGDQRLRARPAVVGRSRGDRLRGALSCSDDVRPAHRRPSARDQRRHALSRRSTSRPASAGRDRGSAGPARLRRRRGRGSAGSASAVRGAVELVEEARRAAGVGERCTAVSAPGERDVEDAPLLLDVVGEVVRHQPVVHAEHDDVRPLHALHAVHGRRG